MDRIFRRRESPAVPPPPEAELQPIRLYSSDGTWVCWVRPGGERVTDILQRPEGLVVLPDGAVESDPEAWLPVDVDALLLVVPPPHTSRPELRVHRQRQEVAVRIGPYRVFGTAHLKPGYAQDPFLRATQPFLPLTDAVVERDDAPPERFDVVIVNQRLVEDFREV